jgi:hypothetical protein
VKRSITVVFVAVSCLGCDGKGAGMPEKEPPEKAIDCLERAAGCLEENGPPLMYREEKRGEEKTGEGEEKAGITNAAVLNGGVLSGVSVNGVELDEVEIIGVLRTVFCAPGDPEKKPVQLDSPSSGCVCGSGLSLEGTELRAGKLGGEAMVGAELLAQLSIGTLVRLRIEEVVRIPVRGTELSGYKVSVRTDEGWKPMCGEEGNVSIAFPGRWDYNQGYAGAGGRIDDPNAFTFACRDFVLAKCIEDLGYFPWRVPDLHEACVRMLRADFCGDGMSWTMEGVEIQIYDRKQVNREEYGEGVDPERWGVEAEWGTGGALCMRSPANHRNHREGDAEPECFCRLESETCGDAFGSCEALIITKLDTGSAE